MKSTFIQPPIYSSESNALAQAMFSKGAEKKEF